MGKGVDGRLDDRCTVRVVPVLFCFNFVLQLFGIIPFIQYRFFHFIYGFTHTFAAIGGEIWA